MVWTHSCIYCTPTRTMYMVYRLCSKRLSIPVLSNITDSWCRLSETRDFSLLATAWIMVTVVQRKLSGGITAAEIIPCLSCLWIREGSFCILCKEAGTGGGADITAKQSWLLPVIWLKAGGRLKGNHQSRRETYPLPPSPPPTHTFWPHNLNLTTQNFGAFSVFAAGLC